jgi:tripartite-type tricarboxylate transporter receptor subunit TctC
MTRLPSLALFLVLASAFSVSAQSIDFFYKDRRLTLITSASVGGGYDQYARLIAKHIVRHIPGNPSIIVQNMTGAEGILAANHLYNIAAQDGSVVGGLQRNNGMARFYDPDNAAIRFDARKFHWLGSPQQEVGLFLVNTAKGVATLQDLKGRAITASSTARNSPTSIYPRMLNELYGTKIRVVEGYDGSQSALLALERGEVDAHVSGGSSAAFRGRIAPWLESGKTKVVMQMGMTRDPQFRDVPTAIELMESEADKQVFEIAFVEQVMGRPFLMPPGTPADRVRLMRAAFAATMKDPTFLQEAKASNMEIDPVSGEEINRLLDRVYSAPPDVAQRIRELLK